MLVCILSNKPALSLDGIAIAQDSKPEINFPHNLYFVEMGKEITIEWSHNSNDGDVFEVRAYHIEGDKHYTITDIDGSLSNLEAKFTCPRTGHLLIQLRTCNLNTAECGDWIDGKETATTEEPIGWFLFVRPAAVTGGGID